MEITSLPTVVGQRGTNKDSIEAAVRELSFRPGQVCLKSFADDLRGGMFISDSRIYVPEMYTEPSRFATVVALGPMRWVPGTWWYMKDGEPINGVQPYDWCWIPSYYKPFEVNVGETVVSSRYPKSAQAILWHGQEFVIVDENEILARVEHHGV